MAKRYKMTAKRRAALRKAQAASARKRRRRSAIRTARVVGSVAGSVLTSAAVYHANAYARDPGKAIKDYKSVKSFATKRKSKSITPAITRKRKPIGHYPSSNAQRAALRRRAR